MSDPADIQRLVGDLVRVGTVISVDCGAGTCRLQVGEIETPDLPWHVPAAGAFSFWLPPSVGEQRELVCAEGDIENGVVGRALYSDANAAPSSNPEQLLVRAPDGAILSYNAASSILDIDLPAAGHVVIKSQGGVTIDAQQGGVFIQGDLTVQGKLTASDDVVAAGISLKSHRHPGVQAGGARTQAPE